VPAPVYRKATGYGQVMGEYIIMYFARMITIATIEGGYANYYEFQNPFALNSMLAEYQVDMKTIKMTSFALQ